ncbi:MAG: hypothetical protein M1828_006106 [Chrysothrix sp. TS-e1954]|nr:MAG: hypothetical protein M1828_006106 [Chrysothrix sp. TS-e1954]
MGKVAPFREHTSYQWSSSDASKTLPVYNPATGKLITTIRVGDASTVDKAVEVSQKAFEKWRWEAPLERGRILLKCAETLRSYREELAELLCMENGKPLQDALPFDVDFLIRSFEYFGSIIGVLPSEHYDRGNVYVSVVREPHGVCAGILPFNWPPIHTGGKSAPALACGNSIILKPGEQAPLTVMRMVEILNKVLPEGLLQAIPGEGLEVPQALLKHPKVRMVSFTGSTAAGKAISKTAADTLKHVKTELGGKNAFVIFDDADLDRAVRDALEGVMFNKGEACTASSRILIQDGLYDKFVERLGAGVKKVVVGNGMHEATMVGPCVDKAQQKIVLNYINIAKEEGARIVAQAPLPSDPAYKDGYFVPPTLFADVTRDMRIAKEEMFGPMATCTRFKTEDEAMSIVNESQYGLVGILHTMNQERADRVSRRMESGIITVNNYRRNFQGVPFGGVKESGNAREHCIETLQEWSSAKTIQKPSGLGELGEWRAVTTIYGPKKQS